MFLYFCSQKGDLNKMYCL